MNTHKYEPFVLVDGQVIDQRTGQVIDHPTAYHYCNFKTPPPDYRKDTLYETPDGYYYPSTNTYYDPSERHQHPVYNAFVDGIGRPFRETNHVFPIMYNHLVKIWHDGHWMMLKPERFAYECFTNSVLDDNQAVKQLKHLPDPFGCIQDNLKVETLNIIRHPTYPDYGLSNGEIYSFKTQGFLKRYPVKLSNGPHKRIVDRRKFAYECEHQVELRDDQYLIGDEVVDDGIDTITVEGTVYRHLHDGIYVNGELYYYLPGGKFVPCVHGEINVGTRIRPVWIKL